MGSGCSYVCFLNGREDERRDVGSADGSRGDATFVSPEMVEGFDGVGSWSHRFPTGYDVESYSVGAFSVNIRGEPWPSYRWTMNVDCEPLNRVCDAVSALHIPVAGGGSPFEAIYSACFQESKKRLRDAGLERWLDSCASFCTLSAMGLTPIAPALLDPRVEEVYLDRPGALCYLDHSDYGRLWFPAVVLKATVDRMGLFLQLSVAGGLDMLSTSLKGHLVCPGFHARVSLDGYPLAVDGGSCIVRKFGFDRFNLSELVDRGTVSYDCAALIVGCLVDGHTVVVSGLPRTGKTTLCNSLIPYLPKEWRKITVEDAVETAAPGADARTLRLSTESDRYSDKLAEITKSLHRSPDFVFVGELQNREQTVAAAMLMDVGIPSLQTVHSTSLEGLIARWRDIYGVSLPELRKFLIVVQMEFKAACRKVSTVLAVRFSDGAVNSHTLYAGGEISAEGIREAGLLNAFERGLSLVKRAADT
ncbi:MAG: ATPase, T2SS/T4P/T4SS family [Thermoprotei archaeon]